MSSTRRNTVRLGRQTAELMVAAPQVVAHRLLRIAAAGAHPSGRDQREFRSMGSEKLAAFTQSWSDMALQTLRANQQMALAWMVAPWSPARAATQLRNSVLRIMISGVAPVHKRAVANAKRLRRPKAG